MAAPPLVNILAQMEGLSAGAPTPGQTLLLYSGQSNGTYNYKVANACVANSAAESPNGVGKYYSLEQTEVGQYLSSIKYEGQTYNLFDNLQASAFGNAIGDPNAVATLFQNASEMLASG